MSINYDSAKKILSGGYVPEASSMMANALATLALVDEMRAARDPELAEVFVLRFYNPTTGEEGDIVDVYRDRAEGFGERDRMNALADNAGAPLRYIITEKELK